MTRREQIWRALLAAGGSAPIGWLAKSFGITTGATYSTLANLRRDGCVVRTGEKQRSRWAAVPHSFPEDGRGKSAGTVQNYWAVGNAPSNKDGRIVDRKRPRPLPLPEAHSLWHVWPVPARSHVVFDYDNPHAFSPIVFDYDALDNSPREDAPEETIEAA